MVLINLHRVVLGVTRHSRHQETSTVPSVKAPAGAGAYYVNGD